MAYKRGEHWYATAYDHGRRVFIKAGPSKKVAEQIERDLKTKIVKGEYLGIYDEKRVLFRDFIPRYLNYSQANKRPESASRDARSLKALAESFGDRYLSEITPEVIELHKERRLETVKPATVNKELATLKHLFTLAVKWHYVGRNPVKEVKLLKEPPGRLRYLLPEQWFRLLHVCALHSPVLKAIVVCARNTGMRQGEILGLTWADVNLRERSVTLSHTKNNELRVVPITTPCSPNCGPCRARWTPRRGSLMGGRGKPSQWPSGGRPGGQGSQTSASTTCVTISPLSL